MAVEDTTLGCGRAIEAVWANIDHPPTSHEATCEQCRAARDSLRAVQELTIRYRRAEQQAQRHPNTADRPRPGVRSTVLAIARAEVRRGRRVPVATTEYGPILISEQTLLALVRAAIDMVPGVRARRISTTGLTSTDATDANPDGGTPELRITSRIAVAPGVSIPAATATARQNVLAVAARHLHLDPDAVDIIVEDLYER